MSTFFGLTSRLSPERYLQNSDYFDSGLIDLLERQTKKIKEDNALLGVYRLRHEQDLHRIHALNHKIKDLKVIGYNLKQKNNVQQQDINDIEKQIEDLDNMVNGELNDAYSRIHELEEELRKYKHLDNKRKKKADSSNSNIPSSFDIVKTTENSRTPSGKDRGGQSGHTVHKSVLSKKPDKVIRKYVKKAPTGALAVKAENGEVLYYATQSVDASFKTTIIETRYFIQKDGKELEAKIMDQYRINPVTYTSSFKSTVIYLASRGAIALDRLCEILNRISNNSITVKPSTIVTWVMDFKTLSEEARKNILNELIKSPIDHVDETGYQVNGKQMWMHTICNNTHAWYVLTEKRKDEETGPLAVLKPYEGIVVHDHFKPYYDLVNCIHAECNEHILRYLKAGVDFYDNVSCGKMILLLKKALHRKHELQDSGINAMSDKEIEDIEKEYDQIIEKELNEFDKEHPDANAKDTPDYIKTFRRMKEYKAEHLRFIHDFDVPFTNNCAEKQMRVTKMHKKISWQSYSLETGNAYVSIMTILETARKQGKNELEEIQRIMS